MFVWCVPCVYPPAGVAANIKEACRLHAYESPCAVVILRVNLL